MKTFTLATQLVVCLAWLASVPTVSAKEDAAPQSPIQFCKQDDALALDFCVAVVAYENTTSASTDLYMTITQTRSSSNGWLGVGLGPAMAGALMFVLYNDPLHPGSNLKTSIRTATGHVQPTELSAMDFEEGQRLPDIRVIRSAYDDQADGSSSPAPDAAAKPRAGTANILIYSSDLWPKSVIDAKSASQPWIWAHNPTSPISGETFQMHSHAVGSGFGFFWTDFQAASSPSNPNPNSSPPSFPNPNKSTAPHLSTEVAPTIYRLGGPGIRNWMFHLHGGLTSLAFLLLYPLGALLLRTSDPRAFNFHWTTQAFASVLLVLGALLGWTLSRRIELVHQFVGLAVVGAVGLQVLLGWRHHVAFLKTKTGSWMGRVHVWVGRGLMAAGWANVLLGLKARGYGVLTLLAAGLVVAVEAVVMTGVLGLRRGIPGLWSAKKKGPGKGLGLRGASRAGEEPGRGLGEEYFELVGEDDDDEDDEDYDEDGRLKADVEWEESTRQGGGGGRTTEGRSEGGIEGDRMKKLKTLNIV